MIKKPIEGMRVVVTDGTCCGGLPTGSVGTIGEIREDDSFIVSAGGKFWHCRRCVKEVSDAV